MNFFKPILNALVALWMTVLSVLGLAGDTFVEGQFPIYAPEAKPEKALRIMSFNVRCTDVNAVPRSRRTDIVLKEILDVAPDSFGVQEATPSWMNDLAALEDYDSVGVGRKNGKNNSLSGEYSAVFYNSKVWKCVDSGTFWLSEAPETPSIGWGAACKRICTWAVLENLETGKQYAHVNTHLDHVSVLARKNGAELIVEFIKSNLGDMPVVFTADLNSTDSGDGYIVMTSCLEDTRKHADDAVEFGTFHNGHPTELTKKVIDYVLCSSDVKVLSYRVVTAGIDGRMVSDHFPIYADVVLPD